MYAKNIGEVKLHKLQYEGDDIPDHYDQIDEDDRKYYLKPLRSMGGQGEKRAARPNLYYALEAPDGTEVFPKLQDGSDGTWRSGRPRSLLLSDDAAVRNGAPGVRIPEPSRRGGERRSTS